MKNLSRDQIQNAVSSTKSMTSAAKFLNVNYKTIRKYAKLYNLHITNMPGKGISKPVKDYRDTISTTNVKRKLWNLGLKQDFCEECGIKEWRNRIITLELHHIDGNNRNNELDNLKILCPNCHSQTPNYRNRKWSSDETGSTCKT